MRAFFRNIVFGLVLVFMVSCGSTMEESTFQPTYNTESLSKDYASLHSDLTRMNTNMESVTSRSFLSRFFKRVLNVFVADCIGAIKGAFKGENIWQSAQGASCSSARKQGFIEGVASFCYNTYNASHPMLNGFYARLTTGITYCNQYLAMAGDTDATMSAEIRFVRALHYFLLMDGWGNIPFTLEPMTKPEQRSRAQMYEWLEQELIGIEPALSEAKAKKSTDAGYGRVDKAACWLLLSRLYLNSEIYTGTAQWQKAKEYADKVIKSSYRLNTVGKGGWTAYQMLFMGDNGETDAAYEALLPLLQDGLTTTSWGTSLFLIAGCFDGEMHANPNDLTATNGVSAQNWGGNRARPDLIRKFFPQNDAPELPSYDMYVAAKDDRALFDGVGRTLNNEDVSTFKSGYAIAKFTNFKTDGSAGHDATFADTDYFLLRVAEAYLTFAEADARLNGGNTTSEGTQAVNSIRSRAHASIRTSAYSLDDICDEWSREFYFEGRRRMDLIRFNRYGGNNNYTWQWKGGSYEGRSFDAHLNIFAIPTNELTANSNLTQNPGY